MSFRHYKYRFLFRPGAIYDCSRVYLGFAISIAVALSPVSGLAQQNSKGTEKQAGAGLNIQPLDIGGAGNGASGSGMTQTDQGPFPVPNKLSNRMVSPDSREIDESWGGGESLKQRSLTQGRDLNEKDSDLSQKDKLFVSVKRTLENQRDDKVFVIPNIASLFFTASQHALIREARAGFDLRAPSPEDDKENDISLSDLDLSLDDLGPEPLKAEKEDKVEKVTQEPRKVRANYIRKLVLNGIVYNGPDRWLIWLNNNRVTQDDQLEQIVDVNVGRRYIELRWYDGFQEKIFPIRLRSGQGFNLDTRSFINAGTGDAS